MLSEEAIIFCFGMALFNLAFLAILLFAPENKK